MAAAAALNCEVLIAGGGVVGAALALDLQQRGFDVRLLERGAGPGAWSADCVDPRVYAVSPASAAYLQSLDVWPEVAAARAHAYERMRVWESLGSAQLDFGASDAGVPKLGWIVEHGLLLSQLWARLGDAAVTGFEVDDVLRTEHAISVSDTAGRSCSGRLLIAADGGGSQVREQLGFDTVGWSYGQRGVVSTVRSQRPHQNTAWQRFLKTGPVALLPLADGRCSIVWSMAEQAVTEVLALDDAAFCAALTDATQACLGEIQQAEPRLSFPLQLQHARRYVGERCALVGDAAHVIHPLAGQGANLGWADAQCLADVLARAARPRCFGLRNLQRYERQRQAANLEMMALTDALNRLFARPEPALQALRNLGLGWVNDLSGLKQRLVREAIGI